MEKIIHDLEEYEGQNLYEYRIIFYSINKKQRQWLISHFQDYSWDQGLSIAECDVSPMPKVSLFKSFSNNVADIEFKFKSSKTFEDKEPDEWSESDLEKNLLTRLIGKEQFFSNIAYSEEGLEDKKATFFDGNNDEYIVEMSKYSSMIKA